MIRKVIQIDEDLCNGCSLCASACHEGAIGMVDGKAKLLRDDYCDGLGNCLPVCPTGAITFVEREAAAFDEAAVEKHMKEIEKISINDHHEHHAHHGHEHHTQHGHQGHEHHGNNNNNNVENKSDNNEHNIKSESENKEMNIKTPKSPCGCPSSAAKTFDRPSASSNTNTCAPIAPVASEDLASNLRQWPVQIQLVPVNAPYFNGAHLLIAADCAAYSHPSFNQTFMKNKITIIGCPKLDDTDYSEKLTKILANNQIKSVTIVRMEVPCCGGIVSAATQALKNSDKMIPWSIVTLGTDGSVLE